MGPTSALDQRAGLARQGRKLKPAGGCDIEDQFGLSARRRQNVDVAPIRPTRALAGGEDFGHFVEIGNLDSAMRAQHFREDARLAGKAAGVRGDRMLRAFALADFQDHHRLAGISRTIKRRDKPRRIAHALDESRDHLRGGIGCKIFDILREIDDRLIAR